MQLFPQDLGTKWHILTVRNRSLGVASVWTKPVEPQLGKLGKRWIEGLPVSPEVAATTLPLTKDKTSGVAVATTVAMCLTVPALLFGAGSDILASGNVLSFLGFESAVLGISSVLGYAGIVGLPRMHLKQLHATPIREEELTPFLTGNVPGLPQVIGEMAGKFLRFLQQQSSGTEPERDSLELAFLSLARDVIRNQTVPKEQEDELRDAIRAIGEALCRLPPIQEIENTGSSILAANQRDEARMLHARSDRESDPVIANSLRRQANALENAAKASENGVVVARRVRALRSELRAQMEVLRLTLPTWGSAKTTTAHTYSAHSEQTLGNIAEAVHSVAREAVAMTDAQEELHAFLNAPTSSGPSSYGNTTDEVQQVLRQR